MLEFKHFYYCKQETFEIFSAKWLIEKLKGMQIAPLLPALDFWKMDREKWILTNYIFGLHISNLIYTACVACRIQERIRPKMEFVKIHFFKPIFWIMETFKCALHTNIMILQTYIILWHTMITVLDSSIVLDYNHNNQFLREKS